MYWERIYVFSILILAHDILTKRYVSYKQRFEVNYVDLNKNFYAYIFKNKTILNSFIHFYEIFIKMSTENQPIL